MKGETKIMGKSRKKRRAKNIRRNDKNNHEIDIFQTKVSFLAGIILIGTVIKDTIGLFIKIPAQYVYGYYFILMLSCFMVLIKKLDKIMKSRRIINFGNYLTVCSVIVFFAEYLFINSPVSFTESIEGKILFIALVGILGYETYFVLFPIKQKNS